MDYLMFKMYALFNAKMQWITNCINKNNGIILSNGCALCKKYILNYSEILIKNAFTNSCGHEI